MNPYRPVYAAYVYSDGRVERFAGIRALTPEGTRDLVAGLLAEAISEGAALELSWIDAAEWPTVRVS